MIYSIIEILAGCGAFLLGFKLLSDNMEKVAGNSLRRLFNRTIQNRAVGVGMGAATTAVVQSSSITTVMVVGFVNAGIMTLTQAASVIMGANIGTTITAQIVALQSFDIDTIFMSLAFVGIMMEMFSKSDRVKSCGLSLAGLGLVFMGLSLMSDTMKSDLVHNPKITEALSLIQNPFILLFVGIALTAIIQSSSAVTTIIITMAATGMIIGNGGNAPLYVILGSNIGTCVTALISSIGTNVNARRASIIHLLFNVIGSVIFMGMLLIWKDFNGSTFERWFTKPATQIAMFHTFFNVVCTLLFLPFSNLLVRAATFLVPEKNTEEEVEQTHMDKRLISTPSIAINQLKKEVFRMGDMAMKSLDIALQGFLNRDEDAGKSVYKNNEKITQLSASISDYLVKVSTVGVSLTEEKMIAALHSDVGDVVRISELAENLVKYTQKLVSEDLQFSVGVPEQLKKMYSLLVEQYDKVKMVLVDEKTALLQEADALEDSIDTMRREMVSEHIARLGRGECKPENNSIYINLVSNLERIGDHINFIGHSKDGIV